MLLKKERGFTLIELMIVVAIIGILAAVAIPKFADLIDKAKEAKTKGNLSAIRSALSIYYGSEEGFAPVTLAGLRTEFMANVPGADIPFVDTDADGSSDTSYSWAENAASIADSVTDPKFTGTTGWAYDSGEPEAWVSLDTTTNGHRDTKGNQISTW